MIRIVRQYPKEITIIALGPLTNIALAIRLDPEFKRNCKVIYWIGGSVRGNGNVKPGIEFNAYFDPPANYIVLSSKGPPIVMVPWELLSITAKVPMDWRKKILGKIGSPQMNFLNAIEGKALSSGNWAAADAKTMAIVMNPKIVKEANLYYVEAIWDGNHASGLTLVDYDNVTRKAPNAIIIEDMYVEVFKSMALLYLGAKRSPRDNTDKI